ncbi:MAG: hypothetical protein KJ749_11015, partial [Planctomycetes bacterium]|nr:hypothetical protein [Planctomycetota bacterium]
MDLIRRHAFMIIGVVGALAGIALAVTGLRAMPRVVTEMEQASRLYQDLDSLQSGAVNRDSIEAEERRIEQTREDYAEIVAQVRKLYHYEPLVPNVFPNGSDDARRAFRKAYNNAMRRLFESLRAG